MIEHRTTAQTVVKEEVKEEGTSLLETILKTAGKHPPDEVVKPKVVKERKKREKHTPFWFRVIQAAEKRRAAGLTPFYETHVELAKNWQTCACGRQDKRIPRHGPGDPFKQYGSPVDSLLRHYGSDFYDRVRDQDVEGAMETMLNIERRAAEVLAELPK